MRSPSRIPLMKPFRLLSGLTGLTGLALILTAMGEGKSGLDLSRHITNYFSYLIVQSNILTVAAFLAPVMA